MEAFAQEQGFQELWVLDSAAKQSIMAQVGALDFLPTKGFLTLLLALFLCGQVDAYGFVTPTSSDDAAANSPLPYHYWEGRGSKPFNQSLNEKPNAEHLLLRDLASAASATRPKANGAICA